MKSYKVDVIIPTYKPDKNVEILIKRLIKQTVPINKIIIMNTEKSLWRQEIENITPDIQVHHLKKIEFDHGRTRAQAADMSDADIMVFMTQDAMPADDHLLENLLCQFEKNDNVGAAYARQLPNPKCSYVESFTRSFNYPEKSVIRTKADIGTYGIKTYFCSNVCAAYRKDIYSSLGGFVRKTIFNEDMIYAGKMVQAGYAVAYAADAKVIHSHNYSCAQQFHRNFDLGVSQAEHPEIFGNIRSEGEGMKLVKKTLVYLLKTGRFYLIPGFVFQTGFKYTGYLAGKNYHKIPKKLVLFCTMNHEYWK